MFATSLVLAIREIRRHVLRSFLTILGIVIGVASVITMVTLAKGAAAQVTRQISLLGANILQIRPAFDMARRPREAMAMPNVSKNLATDTQQLAIPQLRRASLSSRRWLLALQELRFSGGDIYPDEVPAARYRKRPLLLVPDH